MICFSTKSREDTQSVKELYAIMMNQNRFNCIYCDRYFHFKDLFDNHRPTCEFFYRSKKERIHSIESIETLPNQQELYHLVQHLTKTVRLLEEDVAKMKSQVQIRIRKSVLQRLQQQPVPQQPLHPWIKTFPVKIQHLEEVFQPLNTLYHGIKKCVAERILSEGVLNIPLRSFREKPGILYVFAVEADQVEPKWMISSVEHWHRIIDAIVHEFIRAFCLWEDDHRLLIERSVQEKDRHIQNLVKITGSQSLKERQRQELKSWLYTQVLQP